jgi:uncharacterized protein (TIGR03790 family)
MGYMGSSLYQKVLGIILLNFALACRLFGGGSGLNTIVIVNQNSSNSCELGTYYCQQRQVPPQNVLYINWPGGNTMWTSNDLQTTLVKPLLNMLEGEGLTSQIQYLVLSMDIPFQTSDGGTVNSTTSALFYGLRLGNGSDPSGIANSYAASEGIFNPAATTGAPGYSFLTTMITGNSLTQAEQLVAQGVASDGTFPQQPVILAKSSDVLRNIRYTYFDNAIFNVNLLDVSTIFRTNTDAVWWPTPCLGYETGLANFNVPSGFCEPGTIADSMTSYGGVIFGNNSQTSLLSFTTNGAAGSYGTVTEPENDTQKFPNPEVYFYQARGFSLAESYYQSVNIPYLGLTVAEPLAAPFAWFGSGQWNTNLANTVLSGTTNLTVNFTAHDSVHPLQQVDLFLDGVYYSTVTNLVPNLGNQLTVTLNGYPITYTVPTNSTLSTVAAGLGSLINASSSATQVKAIAYGDRIQLQSTATNPAAIPFFFADGTAGSTPGLSFNVNYLPASTPPQILPGSLNKKKVFTMNVGIPSTLPYVIIASTNLESWQPIFTNSAPGLLNFTDYASTNYPQRFYAMEWPAANQPPQVSAPAAASASTVKVHVAGVTGQSWAIQTSTDLVNWTSLYTNQTGGAMDYVDTNDAGSPSQFYRALLTTSSPPTFTVMNTATNLTWVQVTSASLPYTVDVSTNAGQWTALATNFAIGQIQMSVANTAGGGNALDTFLNPAQPAFMASTAFGYQGYTVISNFTALPTNAWIQFTFTLTNGQAVTEAVTNVLNTNSVALAFQLYNEINADPALQGSNGVQAEDFVPIGTSVNFNIYARSPGYQAALIQVQPRDYKVIMTTTPGTLTQNLSDLQPRNHLYVSAGASRLGVTFPLATTNLADGYHQLTAVAYEGTDVRTETQVTMPVQIQNTPLSATLTLLDVNNSAPVYGTYHMQVTANTNNVSQITLYSTGGAVGSSNGVSSVVFPVAGTNLWNGLHPFYAIVQTSSGLTYRTQTQYVTFY